MLLKHYSKSLAYTNNVELSGNSRQWVSSVGMTKLMPIYSKRYIAEAREADRQILVLPTDQTPASAYSRKRLVSASRIVGCTVGKI